MKRNNQRIVFPIHFRTVGILIVLFSQHIAGSLVAGALRLQRSADALLFCGEKIVAAAALLGENGILEEDPASLSNGGCALTNAGRDLSNAYTILYANDEGCEWEEAANEGFYPAAGELRNAGASLHYCDLPLTNAGNYLDSASQVTGCIVMAAVASDDLIATGKALTESGLLITNYGILMLNGGKVEKDAGELTKEAGASLILAGEEFIAYGEYIGLGKAN